MTVTLNGSTIQIARPVHSISVNKNRVAFKDVQGDKCAELASASERRSFIELLVKS
ncbi:hypothetical protein [Ferrimonas pelagia]|uniref:Uncharacterized protein n=1 Tax=Ferrimonas pelagia TaxID=1177826 RepID=A0ABP9ESW8_9GAMM